MFSHLPSSPVSPVSLQCPGTTLGNCSGQLPGLCSLKPFTCLYLPFLLWVNSPVPAIDSVYMIPFADTTLVKVVLVFIMLRKVWRPERRTAIQMSSASCQNRQACDLDVKCKWFPSKSLECKLHEGRDLRSSPLHPRWQEQCWVRGVHSTGIFPVKERWGVRRDGETWKREWEQVGPLSGFLSLVSC